MSDMKHTQETKLKQDNFRIRFDDEEEDFVAECNDHDDVEALIHRYNHYPALLEALRKARTCASIPDPVMDIIKEALATARA